MKSTTMSKPIDSSFDQMLAKAELEIARLAKEEKRIQLQMATDQAELQGLQTQAEAHETEKQIAQETVTERRRALREAETLAELATGTLSKPGDVKALEKLLKQAQQDQMVILDRVGKEEQAEERRRHMLEEAMDRNIQTLAHLAERKEAMEATKERVLAEQGETTFQQCLNQLNALQADLHEKEQAVTQAREAIDNWGRDALESLSQWAELESRLKRELPYDDPTTQILEAMEHLVTLLLEQGIHVERFSPYFFDRAGISRFASLDGLLSIGEHALHPVLYGNGEPVTLHQRKTDLEKLLQAYKSAKQGER